MKNLLRGMWMAVLWGGGAVDDNVGGGQPVGCEEVHVDGSVG